MKITIQNLYKSFGGKDIFSDFSLDIETGVHVCVAGPNGCGKSTLIRMIAGVDRPDSGRIIIPSGSRIGYVEQELDISVLEQPLLSWVLDVLPDWHDFWENWEKAVQKQDSLYLSKLSDKHTELEMLYGYNPEHRAKEILSGLGFAEDIWNFPLSHLSGGWRERAKLARVLIAGADILLLDEPTNHLDLESVEWLEEFLKAYKGIIVFVAHDRTFMDAIGTHILYLGGMKPVYRKTTFSQFMIIREEIEEQKVLESQRITSEIKKKMDFVRRFGAKASKARQASSRQKIAKKLKQELEEYKAEPKQKELRFVWPEPPKADKIILSASDLTFSFLDNSQLWQPLTFTIYNGQRIALVGPNGSGKSTLLKLISGELNYHSGSLIMGNLVRLGYYNQHQTELLHVSGTVLGEIRRLSDPKTTEEELMSVLGLFLLGQGYFDRTIQTLSGGERSRLVLALLFLKRANFLVLDEPTNHLDLESREALTKALRSFKGTLLIVAHDRYLCSEVTEETWEISSNGLIKYEEGFAQYDEIRKHLLKNQSVSAKQHFEPTRTNVVSSNRDELKRRKREQAEKRKAIYSALKPKQENYTKLEAELTYILEEQNNLEQYLTTPESYNDSEQLIRLFKKFDEIKKRSEELVIMLEVLEKEIVALEKQREIFSSTS